MRHDHIFLSLNLVLGLGTAIAIILQYICWVFSIKDQVARLKISLLRSLIQRVSTISRENL